MRVYRMLRNVGGLVADDEVVVVMVGAQLRVQRRDRYAGSGDYMAFVQLGDAAATLQLVPDAVQPPRMDDPGAEQRDAQAHAIIAGGGGGGSGSSGSGPMDVQSSLQSVTDLRASQLSTTDSQASTTTRVLPCQKSEEVPVVWQPGTDDLVVPVEICTGVPVRLGHSFAEMAERENYLREESGVFATSSSVDGPNNALGEVRMLIANAACEAFQIAVRFADTDGRNLLFRSTAGHVLILDRDSGEVRPRTHTVRAALVNDGYRADETFVHAGCHSFFVQDESAADEPRLMTPEAYAAHHEEGYREVVSGLSNAQQYHHSEQAFFKLLYDHPNVVSDALDSVLATLESQVPRFVARTPVRLCAVAVDVFTTRAACSGCTRSSQRVQTQAAHFFAQALKDVRAQRHPVTVEVPDGVRTMVRIAAARPFVGTPSRDSVARSTPPVRGTMHALPADPIRRAGGEEPQVVYQRVTVLANHVSARPLLRTGTERSETTWVEQQIRVIREQDWNLSRKDAAGWWDDKFSTKRHLHDAILLAAEIMRLDERVHQRKIARFGSDDVESFALRRFRFAVRMIAAKVGSNLPAVLPHLVFGLVRHFRAFVDGDPFWVFDEARRRRFHGPTLLKIIRIALTQPDAKEGAQAAALAYVAQQLEKQEKDVLAYLMKEIDREIQKNMDEATATGENRALNLALEFDRAEAFRERRPRWGNSGSSGGWTASDPTLDAGEERRARPTARAYLADSPSGAQEEFSLWLAENHLREGAATAVGNNCALHTIYQLGGPGGTRENQHSDDYAALRRKYAFEEGADIELGKFTDMVEDTGLHVRVWRLNVDGTVSVAGVFGTRNEDGSNERHILHVGMHYEPLWPVRRT